MEDGAPAEIAISGNDGQVGIALLKGGKTTPGRAVVQSADNGYRLGANVAKREFIGTGMVVEAVQDLNCSKSLFRCGREASSAARYAFARIARQQPLVLIRAEPRRAVPDGCR